MPWLMMLTVSWLGLHPQEIADRVNGSCLAKPGLALPESIALGSIGFMLVSVAGFAPWALAGWALRHSVGWIIGWMALRGNVGSLAGLLLGTTAMDWLLVRTFDSRNELLKVVAVFFVLNAVGYFAGGRFEGYVAGMRADRLLGFAVTKQERMRAAMLLWGACYGLGLGAGLGLAFHYCQSRARALLGQGDQGHAP